jgi:hypothetical protein
VILIALSGCAGKESEWPEIAAAKRAGLITTADEAFRYNLVLPNDVSGLYARYEEFLDGPLVAAFLEARGEAARTKAAQALEPELRPLDVIGRSTDYTPNRDWKQGMEMDFSVFVPMKKLLKVYCLLAINHANRDDVREAMRYLGMGANIVKQCSMERPLIGKMVLIALSAVWIRSAIDVANNLPPDAAEYGGLLSLAGRLPDANYKEAFGYEIVLARESLQQVREGKKTLSSLVAFGPDSKLDEDLSRALKAASIDGLERAVIGNYASIAKVWTERSRVYALQYRRGSPDAEVAAAFSSLPPRLLKDMELRHIASIRCLKVAIAAAVLRLESGRWPTLSASASRAGVSELDPFGTNLKYRPDGAGILVYSVGADGKDDGGLDVAPAAPRSDSGVIRLRLNPATGN